MPGPSEAKHVRFDEWPTYYPLVDVDVDAGEDVHFAEDEDEDDIPRTPSPTFSLPTASSDSDASASPRTPPADLSLFFGSECGDDMDAPVLLHPALVCASGGLVQIGYNVSLPLGARQTEPDHGLWDDSLRAIGDQPATYPPQAALTLLSDLLPYPIYVPASAYPYPSLQCASTPSRAEPATLYSPPCTAPSAPFVTISSLLSTLHAFLRTPLSHAELAAHPRAARVRTAFRARLAAFNSRDQDVDADAEETRCGVRRVDLLLGATRFAGLAATKRRDVWVVEFRE